jgi:hypothetical protein
MLAYAAFINNLKHWLIKHPFVSFLPDPELTNTNMQYQLISATSLDQLEKVVNNELRHSWEVTGGLVFFTFDPKLGNPTSPKP